MTSIVRVRPLGRPGRPSHGSRIVGSRAGLVLALVVYATLLHWTYHERISPAFSYLGLRYREPNPWYYLLAFGLVCGLAFLMPAKLRLPSDFVLWVLFVMATVPSILIPQYGDILSKGRSLELAVYVTLSFGLVVILAHRGPRNFVQRVVVPPALLWSVVLLVSIGTYGYLLYTTGLSFRFVSLAAVRELRLDYRDQVVATGPILGYLVRLQGNVINPLIIARGVYSRRWSLAAAGTVGQLLIFAVTGFKLTILSSLALIALAVLFRIRRRPPGQMILWGTVGSTAAALIVDVVQGGLLYTEIFVNRLLLTPGVLTAAHVLVFQDQAKAEWGYSFMAPFVDYPYSATPAFLVGEAFSGSAITSANANFFADGYANLGYPGMFVEAAVLVLILWFVNSAARNLPLPVSALILFVPTLALVNSSVSTSLLTNGFLATIVIMACLPPSGWGLPRRSGDRRARVRRAARTVGAPTDPA